jgi:hypothetical protein
MWEPMQNVQDYTGSGKHQKVYISREHCSSKLRAWCDTKAGHRILAAVSNRIAAIMLVNWAAYVLSPIKRRLNCKCVSGNTASTPWTWVTLAFVADMFVFFERIWFHMMQPEFQVFWSWHCDSSARYGCKYLHVLCIAADWWVVDSCLLEPIQRQGTDRHRTLRLAYNGDKAALIWQFVPYFCGATSLLHAGLCLRLHFLHWRHRFWNSWSIWTLCAWSSWHNLS